MSAGNSTLPHIFAELRRRKVWRVAAIYLGVGVGVIALANDMLPWLRLPDLAVTFVIAVVLLGFPIALALAWTYDLTWGGIERTAARPRTEDGHQSGAVPNASATTSGISSDARPGLVVLPFDNLSPDPGDAWFCDGLTEEITADLSGIRSLRVISRTSAMQLKGSGKDVRTIGRELAVRYVLEGSVRKAGDRLRVTAQLIESLTDAHIWSERYDGELGDVFTIQEDVSRAIAAALRLRLTGEEERALAERRIQNVQAYELYLRARQRTLEWTPEALDRARHELENGLDLVGPNALFYAGLAYVYFHYVNLGVENDEYIERAEEYARRALELDPGSGEAHLVLGLLYGAFRGDQRAAFRHLRSALDRNPDDAHALLWLIVGHTLVGRAEDARPLVQRAIQVDPLTPMTHYMPVFVDTWSGRMGHSIEELSVWQRMEPENSVAVFFSAITLCHEDHRAEAERVLDHGLRGGSGDTFNGAGTLLLRALRGEPDKLIEETTPQLETTGRRDAQFSYLLAEIHALPGLRERALYWLGNAVDRGFCNHPFMTMHDPLLTSLRGTPEFQKIAARAKEEWLTFDA